MNRKLNGCVEALEAATSLGELRDAIVASARELMSTNGVCFMPYEPGVPFGTNGAYSHDEFPTSVMRAQALAMFPNTLRDAGDLDVLFGGEGERCIDLNARLEPRGFERTEVYNEFWRPYRLERQALALVGSPARPLCFICVSRRKSDAPFSAHDFERFERLRVSVRGPLTRLLQADARPFDVGAVLASGLPVAAALFDAQGQLLWSTDPARRALGLTRSRGTRKRPSSRLSEWRAAALRAIARPAEASAFPDLSVQRVETSPGVPAALVIGRGPANGLEDRVARAARHYRLTRRETELVFLLLGGSSNKELSTELCCSVRTVEAHVSSILKKASCASRTELMARLALEL